MTLWHKIERDVRDTLGEGATWCARDQAFYWVDIWAPALNRLRLADGAIERWAMPAPIGWVASRAQGGLVGGFQDGVAEIALDPLFVAERRDPEPQLPENRMNDGKADRHGTIWCGTLDMAEDKAAGSLYRLSPQGAWQVIDSGYTVPNGPAFSPCGRWLYHSDSALRTIYRFALDADGAPQRPRETFIHIADDEGYPDGMTTDSEGFLWVAHWDGGRISRFDPEGRRERSIAMPARRVTNIAFAGEGLDRMFVTSAAKGLPASEYDGALFEVDAGVVGNQTGVYRG